MRVTELSFSEIGLTKLEVFSMFYLYIDEVLISQSKDFNEITTSIFNYYSKNFKINVNNIVQFSHDIQNLLFGSLHGLILHQYDYFKYLDHEVQLYYGFEK